MKSRRANFAQVKQKFASCDQECDFLTEHVEEAPGGWMSTDALFKDYRRWMLESNYRPTGAANFKKAVKRIFPKSYEKRERVGLRQMTVFYNIKVMSDLPTGVQAVQI